MIINFGQSNFIIAVDKPKNMTSHDLVNICRKIFNTKKVGHMGTLDPLATGLIFIGIGQATRLNSYLELLDKSYKFTVKFGQTTSTYDSEGEILSANDVPNCVIDSSFSSKILSSFIGEQKQKPPVYSAIKINGKTAYKEARKGNLVDLPLRDINIFNLKLLNSTSNSWEILAHVSKGTYIRSLAYDIGKKVGCGAYVENLRRVGVSDISVEDAVKVNDLEKLYKNNQLESVNFLKFLDYRIFELDKENLQSVFYGKKLYTKDTDFDNLYNNLCVTKEQILYGIYELAYSFDKNSSKILVYKPKAVFNKGIIS